MATTEKNANAFDMTSLTTVNSGYSLMLINNSTNEGQLIRMTDLATMILNEDQIPDDITDRIDSLENRIAGIAGGVPTVVSSTSEMTDTDKIYILSTDGNWYYHNGSAWVAGGTYGAVATDTTLTQSGAPADAKVVGDEIADLKSDLRETENEIIRTAGVVEELECGLTEEVKAALLACFAHVAWISDDGQTYYDALSNVLNRSRVLSSIRAVFTQGSVTIYDTDELYALKQYLTVTVTYSDGTTKEVNNYTLSGKLVAGTNTITVVYNKKTTTFNVTVTHQAKTLESISATFNSSASITTDNVLDDLRPYLTVRAFYSNGSTNTITNYVLRGSLNVGVNTITVTYDNKTATFTVNVTQTEKTLQSISAVFNQGSAVIYTDSSLNDLKQYLTVTARYSDGTTQTVTGYALSGTLTEGTSTITASYDGKTATFNVTVTETSGRTYYANYDFTESLNDKSGHGEVVLSHGTEATSNAQRTSSGLVFSQPAQIAYFGEIDPVGKTFEFTISNFDFRGSTDSHIRLLMCSNGVNGMGPLIYRKDTGYGAYSFWKSDLTLIDKAWGNTPWKGLQGSGTSVINLLSGKTVKIVFENSHTVALYLNDVLKSKMTDLYYNTAAGATPTAGSRYNKLISFGGTTDTPTASEGDQCYNLTLRDFKIYDNE